MRLDWSGPRPRLDPADPGEGLTRAQVQAMAFDRELLVSAGAGAGKTRTLALRFVALLLDLAWEAVEAEPRRPRPDIEAVLVMTFTEKAAEEMAERCYQRLLELARTCREQCDALAGRYGAARARGLVAALDHLVDAFPLARISTFHGFCARLLREFPAETSTAPGFEVLDGARADRLLVESCEQAFAELAAAEHDDLGTLLDAFSNRRGLVRGLAQALRERGVIQGRLREHARGEVDEAWLVARSPLTPEAARRFLHAVAKSALDELTNTLWPVLDHVPWARRAARLAVSLEHLPEDPLALFERYVEVLRAPMTDGSPPKLRSPGHSATLGTKALWPDARRYDAAKATLTALFGSLSDWPDRLAAAARLPRRADRTLLTTLGAFGRLAGRAEDILRAELHERGGVDFAGLQARAARAIAERPELLDQLRRRHRYLMVDEFQDTDEVQWRIVRALGRPEGPEVPGRRIFLVGDTKQAIYGFRGGDVTVVDTARRELGVTPLVFPENFRSHPRLIRWFNELFGDVLGPWSATRPAYEAHYEPLVPGRPERDVAPGGSVRLLLLGGATGGDGAEAEATLAARWIAGRVLAGQPPYDHLGAADLSRHPTPPVAVLLKTRTHLGRWEAALRAQGVPYVVAGGVGFWRRREVMDLVNGLDALATHDRTSLVGLLRSPLFGLTDQHMQDLYQAGLLDGFHWRALPEGTPAEVLDAQARLMGLARLRDRVPPARLLEAIVEACGGWHLYALEDDGGQAEGNVRRLIEMVEAMDASGVDGVEEIARELGARVQEEPREAEAALSPGEARVVLMTVHQSKGLEFPVVVVPQLNTANPNIGDDLLIRRLGGRWELACRVPDEHGEVQARVTPGLYDELAEVRRAEELAELKRLLYVAVTRAEDHVVLLGSPAAKVQGRSWMELLQLHHGTPPISDTSLEVVDGEGLLDDAPPPRGERPPPPPPGPEAARRAGPLPDRFEIELSPSGLDLYLECPARWHRRHLLGVSEHVNRRQVREQALAAARGEVIHGLLEDDLADDVALARARWEARAHAEGCDVDEVERLLPRLLEHLAVAAADPWLREVMASPGWAEVPFRIARGDLVLRGKIDRIWRPAEGEGWAVLDYKSEALTEAPADAAARHQRQLLAYAWAATRILSPRGQGAVRDARVYFTEQGVPVQLGPYRDEDFAAFEALLDEIAALARLSWQEVEREVTRGPVARPCRDCGFFTRGCGGWDAKAVPDGGAS